MDGLTRFQQSNVEVDLSNEEGSAADMMIDNLNDIRRELILQRKGVEAFVYDAELEHTDEVDMEEVPVSEVEEE